MEAGRRSSFLCGLSISRTLLSREAQSRRFSHADVTNSLDIRLLTVEAMNMKRWYKAQREMASEGVRRSCPLALAARPPQVVKHSATADSTKSQPSDRSASAVATGEFRKNSEGGNVMRKITLFVVSLLLLATTGLAQRNASYHIIELTTTNPDHALYLKAVACKNVFTAKFNKMTFDALSVQVSIDKEALIPRDDPLFEVPITYKVLVDTVTGETDVEIGEIVLGADDPATPEDETECVGFLNYWSRPDLGPAGPLPAPAKIKTVKLMQDGQKVAEGSF